MSVFCSFLKTFKFLNIQEAANTAAVGIGLPLITAVMCEVVPVIGTVMVIGFTFYGGYRVLDNMYDLGDKVITSVYDLCFSNADTVEIEKNELLLQIPQNSAHNNAYNDSPYYDTDYNITEECI